MIEAIFIDFYGTVVFEDGENVIHLVQLWMDNSDDYSTYSIQFQNKSYKLLPEVLFALVVNEIKKKIERDSL